MSLPRNARSQALHAQAMTRATALGSRGRLLRSALPPRVSTPLWRERAVRRPNADLDALFLLTCIHIPTRSPDAGKHPACSIAEPSNGSARHSIARHQAGRWHAPRRARCRPEKRAKNARIEGQHLGFRRTRLSSWNQDPLPAPCVPRISVVKASAGTRLLRRTTDERARSRSDVVIRRFRLQGSRQLPAWNDAVVDLSPDPPSGWRQAEHLGLHIIRRRGLIVLVMRATRFFDGKSGCELDRLLSFSTPPPRCG